MALRKQARERREYIFRKSLQPKYRAEYRAKKQLQNALDNDAKVPEKLKTRFDKFQAEMKADDVHTKDFGKRSGFLDDEYGLAGVSDPKILMTTSREATNKLLRFVKEMKLMFPNSVRVNRGNIDIKELMSVGRSAGFTDIFIFHEHSGIPDGLIICHLPYGPSAYFSLTDVIARHDLPDKTLPNLSEQYPHLVFNNFNTLLGERVKRIIKYTYPVMPESHKQKCRRIISWTNVDDYILFRHHCYRKKADNSIELIEIGPRFTMRLYQIKLGTIEQTEAPTEWVLRPYFNTAWKRKAL